MTSRSNDRNVVPLIVFPMPEGFEVCWAGRNPIDVGLCFGSTDGKLLLTDEHGAQRHLGPGCSSGEAINGVVGTTDWVVASTRADVNFMPVGRSMGRTPDPVYVPMGAHGISLSRTGKVVASAGLNGILVVESPFDEATSVVALGDERLYAYRTITIASTSGDEFIFGAARTGGLFAGPFLGAKPSTMRTATVADKDIIDVCALKPDSGSLAVAFLAKDGTIYLFRDLMTEAKPLTMKFRTVKGVAYRILSARTELYVLTSAGLFALGKVVSRFLAGELDTSTVTQVLTMPMDPIDANVASDGSILVVLLEEVHQIDTRWIHDNIPDEVSEKGVEPVSIPLQWGESSQLQRVFALAS